MGEKRFLKGFLLWFTGLPGSGKSTAATGAAHELEQRGYQVHLLRMDERRKVYFPNPTYSAEERQSAYERFADEGAALAGRGEGVILDATAHRLCVRNRARGNADRFAEMHVRCSLEEAVRREEKRPRGLVMAGLYRKALERRRTGEEVPGLGQVIGVDTPFEEDENAECTVDNTSLGKEETLARIMVCLNRVLDEWGVFEPSLSETD